MRARDEDRTHTCATLDAGLADGQLSAAEHRSRIDQAMTAPTLGDLHGLIADLQGTSDLAPVTVPYVSRMTVVKPGSNRGPIVVIGSVILASIVAVIVIVATQPNASSIAAANKPDMFTPAAFIAFTGNLRTHFGDDIIDSMVVYPHYVVLQRAVPGAPRKVQRTYYDGAFDDQSESPGRAVDTRPVDLATIDVDVVAGLLAGAPISANVSNPTTMYYSLGSGDDGPTVSVNVSNADGESGSFTADLSGNFVAVHAFDPTK